MSRPRALPHQLTLTSIQRPKRTRGKRRENRRSWRPNRQSHYLHPRLQALMTYHPLFLCSELLRLRYHHGRRENRCPKCRLLPGHGLARPQTLLMSLKRQCPRADSVLGNAQKCHLSINLPQRFRGKPLLHQQREHLRRNPSQVRPPAALLGQPRPSRRQVDPPLLQLHPPGMVTN